MGIVLKIWRQGFGHGCTYQYLIVVVKIVACFNRSPAANFRDFAAVWLGHYFAGHVTNQGRDANFGGKLL
ncbi:hypothetical protein DPM35_22705 [Mesorhizobium atlanticum]|uniref:Uncharacterized protein n=1 Tax=Mesorhizobium atlanticum TaxID=2233532 RepID=A0A330GPQ4_9HYPH|nr:hypothetical protein DPM35_22705 [Mesorhizobium atlanticum]